MKNTGITRPVDNVGRVVIPAEIRNSLDIKSNDYIDFYMENNLIIMCKHEPEGPKREELLNFIIEADKKNYFKDWPREYQEKISEFLGK